MGGPKKVNISFVFLVLLFILTQTTFMLTKNLSEADSGPTQGNNQIDALALSVAGAQFSYTNISDGVAYLEELQDNYLQSYYSVKKDYYAYTKKEIIEIGLNTNNDVQIVTLSQDEETQVPEAASEPAPAPVVAEPTLKPQVKSVVKHVNANKLNVRSEPTSQSDLVTSIVRGDKVTYYETVGEWARITTWTDKKGYVLAKYLVDSADKVEKVVVQVEQPKQEEVVASRSEESSATTPISAEGQSLADSIIDYAKTLLGVRYKWGGSSTSGFDCSGFTYHVFGKYGISLPSSSYSYSKVGTKVSKSDLQKGDILLWDTQNNGSIGHVGIYLGDGTFIHASSSNKKVVIRSVATYGEKYMGARRVLK